MNSTASLPKDEHLLSRFGDWFWHGAKAEYAQAVVLVHPGAATLKEVQVDQSDSQVVPQDQSNRQEAIGSTSEIQEMKTWVKAWRVIVFLISTAQAVFSINHHQIEALDYFTSWGLMITCLAFIMLMIITFWPPHPQNPGGFFAPWKWYIILFEVAIAMETIITPFYWILIHGPPDEINFGFFRSVVDHSFPLLFLIIQLCIGNHPFVFRHSVIFVVVGLGYLIIDYFKTKSRGSPTYSSISWDGSTTAYVVPALTIVFGFSFFFMWGWFSKVRERLYRKRDPFTEKVYSQLEAAIQGKAEPKQAEEAKATEMI